MKSKSDENFETITKEKSPVRKLTPKYLHSYWHSPLQMPGGPFLTRTLSVANRTPVSLSSPASGLRYDVRIGTTSGSFDKISPEADPAMGWRRVATLESLGENLPTAFHDLAPDRPITGAVQDVGTSFVGSPFAAEQQFSTSPPLSESTPRTVKKSAWRPWLMVRVPFAPA